MIIENPPEVSIIIPSYNAAKYIERCLESVCNQSYQQIEILFIDNASTDNTKSIVEKMMSKDKRIRYLYEARKGVSAARNKGMVSARGNYFIFVDVDDFVSKDMVAILLSPLEKSDYDIVVGNLDYYIFDKVLDYNKLSFTEDVILTEETFFWLHMVSQTKLYRKDFLLKNKLFFLEDFTEYEDVLFWYHISTLSVKAIYTPQVIYHYVYNPYSNSQYVDGKKIATRFRALRYLLEEITFKNYRNNPYLLPHSIARLFKVIELSIGTKIRKDRKKIIENLLPFMDEMIANFKKKGLIRSYADFYSYAINHKVRAMLLMYHFVFFLSKISKRLARIFLRIFSCLYRLIFYVLRIFGGGGDFS